MWIRRSSVLKLPPKSVGASVDKMFAIGCRPYLLRLSSSWLNTDQNAAKSVLKARKPGFMTVWQGFP